jgi:hypothetical protein
MPVRGFPLREPGEAKPANAVHAKRGPDSDVDQSLNS